LPAFSIVAILAAAILLFGEACERSPMPTGALPIASEMAARDAPVRIDMPFHKILCFGDSITYGVTLHAIGLPAGSHSDLALVEGYVPKLWRGLQSKYGGEFTLVNAGVPGEGTLAGAARIRRELLLHEPDLVLLLEGVIDVNNDAPSFPVVRDNLADLLRQVRIQGAPVVLGTYPLLNPGGFRASNPENIAMLNELIRRLAGEQGVVIADHERAFGNLGGQGPDGLHPNNIGYEVMADTWLGAIETLARLIEGT
jgi:lysophospholipase L1-like esterase